MNKSKTQAFFIMIIDILETKLYMTFITINLVFLFISCSVSNDKTFSNLDYVDTHIGGAVFNG